MPSPSIAWEHHIHNGCPVSKLLELLGSYFFEQTFITVESSF
jgi:hypothetical protein